MNVCKLSKRVRNYGIALVSAPLPSLPTLHVSAHCAVASFLQVNLRLILAFLLN